MYYVVFSTKIPIWIRRAVHLRAPIRPDFSTEVSDIQDAALWARAPGQEFMYAVCIKGQPMTAGFVRPSELIWERERPAIVVLPTAQPTQRADTANTEVAVETGRAPRKQHASWPRWAAACMIAGFAIAAMGAVLASRSVTPTPHQYQQAQSQMPDEQYEQSPVLLLAAKKPTNPALRAPRWIKAAVKRGMGGETYAEISFESIAKSGQYYELVADRQPKPGMSMRMQPYTDVWVSWDPVTIYSNMLPSDGRIYRFRVRVIDESRGRKVAGPWSPWSGWVDPAKSAPQIQWSKAPSGQQVAQAITPPKPQGLPNRAPAWFRAEEQNGKVVLSWEPVAGSLRVIRSAPPSTIIPQYIIDHYDEVPSEFAVTIRDIAGARGTYTDPDSQKLSGCLKYTLSQAGKSWMHERFICLSRPGSLWVIEKGRTLSKNQYAYVQGVYGLYSQLFGISPNLWLVVDNTTAKPFETWTGSQASGLAWGMYAEIRPRSYGILFPGVSLGFRQLSAHEIAHMFHMTFAEMKCSRERIPNETFREGFATALGWYADGFLARRGMDAPEGRHLGQALSMLFQEWMGAMERAAFGDVKPDGKTTHEDYGRAAATIRDELHALGDGDLTPEKFQEYVTKNTCAEVRS